MKNKENEERKKRCPACSNFMKFTVCKNGTTKGICKVCNSVIVSKQIKPKEKLIRIVKK